MAPMRPSIMSEGAMTSEPAAAQVSAWRQSASTVSSFSMSPASFSKPSCPWVV